MKNTRRSASRQQCRSCEAIVSTSGFASTAHTQSAGHIAGLINRGQITEAANLQMRADIAAKNRRSSRAQAAARE